MHLSSVYSTLILRCVFSHIQKQSKLIIIAMYFQSWYNRFQYFVKYVLNLEPKVEYWILIGGLCVLRFFRQNVCVWCLCLWAIIRSGGHRSVKNPRSLAVVGAATPSHRAPFTPLGEGASGGDSVAPHTKGPGVGGWRPLACCQSTPPPCLCGPV